MALLLLVSSTVALALLVVHSWRSRGRAVTLAFFMAGLLFGILRGNVVWFIVSTLEGRPEALKPYLPADSILPEIGHDSFQVAAGWVFALYLAWTVSEYILRRVPRYAGRVFPVAALAALFMFAISYCMETTAVATGWWYWMLPTHTALFGNVNTAGIWAWFSVVPDFLMPFLVIICSTARRGALRWLWLAVFPLHMGAHFLYGAVAHASLVYPALVLLVLGAALFSRLGMERGESAPPDRVTAALPAAALVIFFGVIAAGNLLSGGGVAGLLTLVPLALMCVLAWRRVPLWVVAALSGLALAGGEVIAARALYALAPVAAWGLFALLERLREPAWLKLVPSAVVIALAAWVVALDNADTKRAERYCALWEEGDRLATAADRAGALRAWKLSDESRPEDTFGFYCVVYDMSKLDRGSPEKTAPAFLRRMPRLISELEEVAGRDAEWLSPRQDVARLHLLSGDIDAAAEDWRAMHAIRPRDPEIAAALGYTLLRAGRVEEAEKALVAAVAGKKPPADALINLGVIRFHQKRDADARELWSRAFRIDPQQPAAAWNLARLDDPSDDRSMDVDFLATKRVPTVAPWVNNLAFYGDTLTPGAKLRLIREASQIDPLNARAQLNLFQYYIAPRGGFYDAPRALRHARRAEEAARASGDAKELTEARAAVRNAEGALLGPK